MKHDKISYNEAMASPCAACKHSSCCRLLQLDSLTATNLLDLDKINFYLNFDNIEICLTAEGEWIAYYNYHCRYLDVEKSICRVHDTSQQPGICVHFNPYNCYYKKLKETRQNFRQEMIWISRERMDFLMSQISFDEDRNISEIPGKEQLFNAISRVPYQAPKKVEAPKQDKIFNEWQQSLLSNTITSDEEEAVLKSHLDFQKSCRDCDSYCCQNLLFAQGKPSSYSSLDYLKYALAFPGIELGISDEQWYLIAKTKCRYLENMLCTVYENQERPLLCRYYNAAQCIHKPCLGKTRPQGFMRVRYEEFNWIMETFKFDEDGRTIEGYDVNSLRVHIESKWLETADKIPREKGANKGTVNEPAA
ncbi:MAG: hypothetical protein GY950_29685 [bacterium]|nr:hypothetical protein [bacterium]